MKNMLKI